MRKINSSPKFEEDSQLCSLLLSNQSKPLKFWNKKIRAGQINQLLDKDLHTHVLEILSVKSLHTYITCPADPKQVLGIRAPFLHFTVKNLGKSFVIDILIKDDKNVERRFTALTKQSYTQLKPYTCRMPLMLAKGWNVIIVPLKEYTSKAYRTEYVETLRVQVHATCRVQSVYFAHQPILPDSAGVTVTEWE